MGKRVSRSNQPAADKVAKRRKNRVEESPEGSLEEYIKSCRTSDNDPGLLFSWNRYLTDFVEAANNLDVAANNLDVAAANNVAVPAAPAKPDWISSDPGQMTTFTFQHDVIRHLSEVGGGSYGKVFVAPNNLLQVLNVQSRLRDIETDAFIQAAMTAVPQGAFLADTAIVTDRSTARGIPTGRVAPHAPNRQVFI